MDKVGSASLGGLYVPLSENFLQLAERPGAACANHSSREEAQRAACEAVTYAADTRSSSSERVQVDLVPSPFDVAGERESGRIVDSK